MEDQAPSDARAARGAAGTRHPLLARPLYVYGLPPPLVHSLRLRADEAALSELVPGARSEEPAATGSAANGTGEAAAPKPASGSGSIPACTLCPGCDAFATLTDQRAHFRSAWHHYNLVLRQRSSGDNVRAPLVTAPEFDELCAGVESDESEGEGEDAADGASGRTHDPLEALVRRLDLGERRSRSPSPARQSALHATLGALRSPLVWFETRPDARGDGASDRVHLAETQLGVHRDLLPDTADGAAALEQALVGMQAEPITRVPGKHGWTGKRLHGTQPVARSMQMAVLDGEGLLPNISTADLQGGASDEEDEDASSSGDDTLTSDATSGNEDGEAPPPTLTPLPKLRLWTILMLGGGHFAAAVVALNPHEPPQSARARARGTPAPRSVVVLAHKTFHRYTTRRKQGGSQAALDASGKHAKSAGANLRRYGEARLGDDIRALLGRRGWRELIGASERVWVRTSMRTARGVLWHWTGSANSPLDEALASGKLAHLPLATQRPTLGEIMRCFFELTRVKVAHLSAEQLAAQTDAQREAITQALRADAAAHAPAPPAPPVQRAPRARRDEHEARRRVRLERLVSMVRKGKVDALDALLTRHEADLLRPGGWDAPRSDDAAQRINAPLPTWWRRGEAKSAASTVPATLLQLAALAGQAEVVQYLLVERRADPTLPVPRVPTEEEEAPAPEAAHRTAFDLASSKPARAVFRRLMADQPEWWDWAGMGPGGARVPSALTSEMEEAQASKARNRRAALRERAREREAKAAAKPAPEPAPEPVPEPAPAPAPKPTRGPQKLGGGGPAGADAGLSDEMRMRVEREKRARAAEARMQALKRS